MSSRVQFDPDTNTFKGTRTIRESGGSAVLTLPPPVLDATRLGPGDDVRLTCDVDAGTICIKKKSDDAEDESTD